jgi:hypothetical protein
VDGSFWRAQESLDLDEVGAILAEIRKGDQRAGGVTSWMRGLLKRRYMK